MRARACRARPDITNAHTAPLVTQRAYRHRNHQATRARSTPSTPGTRFGRRRRRLRVTALATTEPTRARPLPLSFRLTKQGSRPRTPGLCRRHTMRYPDHTRKIPERAVLIGSACSSRVLALRVGAAGAARISRNASPGSTSCSNRLINAVWRGARAQSAGSDGRCRRADATGVRLGGMVRKPMWRWAASRRRNRAAVGIRAEMTVVVEDLLGPLAAMPVAGAPSGRITDHASAWCSSNTMRRP
jgi:hypothetical protein